MKWTFQLDDFASVVVARRQARAIAEALGAEDSAAVEQVAGELAVNCVEHRSGSDPGWMRLYPRGRTLVIETWNPCQICPDWCSRKNGDGTLERLGGYGLVLAAALATRFDRSWGEWRGGRWVRMRAQFPLSRPVDPLTSRRRAALLPGSQPPDFPFG
jgi:hypothetical protein